MLSRKVGLDFDHGKLVVPELDKLLAAGGLEVAEWRVQDLGLGREGGEPLQVSAVLHARDAEGVKQKSSWTKGCALYNST